ncbi:hypothetical protein ACFLZZ_02215 [Nanoarchaeota archaeon]
MNKSLIALILLSVIIVSGADGCPTGQQEAEQVSSGLEVSFVDQAPPISVPVNTPFPIYVELLNKGGEFINKGEAKVYLSGVGTNLEGVKDAQINERNLAKKSLSPDRIVFAEAAKFTFPIESLHALPLALKSCYTYGTSTQASICVSQSNKTGLCEVGSEKIKSTSNSVAPIQITSIKEEVVGNKLSVFFTIENKLGGSVYLPDTDCDGLQAKEISESFKEDKVKVLIRTTEKGFDCKLQANEAPYAPIEDLSGTANLGTVVCEKELDGNEEYVVPFSIVTRYKYVDTSVKTINILP